MASEREPNAVGVQALAQEVDEQLRITAGLKTEDIRGVRRDFSKRLKDAAPHVVKELAMLLLDLPGFEYRLFAYELIYHHSDALCKLNAWELEQLGRGISNWGAADCFAVFVAGPLWRERRAPASLINDWARSADRWWRRIALVSTVPLNCKARGGRGDAHRTLQVCRMLEHDPDPMVVKAMSWALRELGKVQPQAVRGYLAERRDFLWSRVVREVENKLETGVKDSSRRPKRRIANSNRRDAR